MKKIVSLFFFVKILTSHVQNHYKIFKQVLNTLGGFTTLWTRWLADIVFEIHHKMQKLLYIQIYATMKFNVQAI